MNVKERNLLEAKKALYLALLEMPDGWLDDHSGDLDFMFNLCNDKQIKEHINYYLQANKGAK